MTERLSYFFNDYTNDVYAPASYVQALVTNLSAKMFRSEEMIFRRNDKVDKFVFIYVGVAHLYGYDTLQNGEVIRQKTITLKKGSWFGDFQIMLDKATTWDVQAGSDYEWNSHNRPLGMPHEHILTYVIDAEKFIKLANRYPKFRSHIVTRSVLRRSYFKRMGE